MSHSQQPAPFGQQPLLYAIPYVPPPSVPPPSAPSSSAQPPKGPHSALRLAVGVACALLVLGLAAVVGNGGNATKKARTKPAPTVTGAVTADPAKTANPAKAANPAKTAKAEWTAGPVPSDTPRCHWTLAKGAGSEPTGTIARGTSRGPARVTVNQGETFETHGCKEWTQAR
ncbi:hypothetical protein [Streptomyces lydicus]|uniref:hypothetical protein n=1 Tax=Streptomyces lydicus TaxID=47763 RepID=UPI0010138875|nr:hypothetical protein [Streptomyces lydicus]MCZ1011032.1 hypothetical protein [Streptomyces lydicus]